MSYREAVYAFFEAFSPVPSTRQPEIIPHYFTFMWDDPFLSPMYAEVHVADNDPGQTVYAVDLSYVGAVGVVSPEQVAREALQKTMKVTKYHRHLVGVGALEEYKQKTGLRNMDRWCIIRRNEFGDWNSQLEEAYRDH